MKVTVIIPTYNRADILPRAVASLVRQSDDADLDILIVDDGSTDDTQSVVEKLQHRHPCIRVVSQENHGVSYARNTGLKNLLPETEIVTFLDSDDISPPGRFAADLAFFRDRPEIDFTYGRLLRVNSIDDDTMEPSPDALTANVKVIQLSAGLYRRELIEKTGLFDLEMEQGEDTDFLFRMFEQGAQFASTETMTLYYVRHSGNMTNDLDTSKRYFAKAVLASNRRRRQASDTVFNPPKFDHEELSEIGWF